MESIPKLGKQTISDRLVAAKHTVTGSGLAKAVCKASTEEPSGPKKKHLDYLTQCTNEINVSIPQLADLLIERTQNGNWVVVFKALVTIHHLMGYGNERFIQYLASCNSTFNLGNFLDKSGVAGYDMSPFIRRYSKYLNEKCVAYRQMALDFCKSSKPAPIADGAEEVKRGKDEGMMRKMEVEKLLKTLPVLQTQVDALLDFEVTADELRNGVINGAFLLLFKDLIRLFACYNDGIINLLEKYFDMNKKQCKEALELYKKFLVRVDRVSEFLKVAEQVGIDKGGIPDLAKAPSSLLEALEQHYNSMDEKGTKKGGRTTPAPASGEAASTTSGGSGATTPVLNISEAEKKRLIAEEAARMEALKAEADSRLTSSALDLLTIESPAMDSGPNSASTSPSITAAAQNGTTNGVNGTPATNGAATVSTEAAATSASKPSDLLFEMLGAPAAAPAPPPATAANPFAAPAFGASTFGAAPVTAAAPFGAPAPATNNANPFGAPTGAADFWGAGPAPAAPAPAPPAASSNSNLFASDAQFNQAFASNAQTNVNPQSAPFDPFGEILQPAPAGGSAAPAAPTVNATPAAGNPFVDNPNNNVKNEKLIKGDSLEASLMNLAGNLKINPGGTPGKMEWNNRSPAVTKRTGGVNWAPMTGGAASTTTAAAAPAAPQPAGSWGAGGVGMTARGPSPSFAAPAFGGNPMMAGGSMGGQSTNFNPFDNNPQSHPTSLGPFGASTAFPGQSPVVSPATAAAPFGAATTAPMTQNWGF